MKWAITHPRLKASAAALLLSSVFSLVWAPRSAVAQTGEDLLSAALSEVGFTRADLGYRPKGYWNRYPQDIPHRLPLFDDLFAEPLRLYDVAAVMGASVETYLDPSFADSADYGLYKLLYHLGVDKRRGGFRDYSANLIPAPEGDQPLAAAFEKLYRLGGRPTEVFTFGSESEQLNLRAEVARQARGMPDTVQTLLARALVNLADAIHWRNLALRNCERADLARVIAVRDLAQTQGDGQVYYPEFDDVANTIDWSSLHYAALKTVAAVEQAEFALRNVRADLPRDYQFEMSTPFGAVLMFSKEHGGADPFVFDVTNTLLVVDFGRDAVWGGSPGATAALENPISALIDLGGADVYGDSTVRAAPAAGVGLCGVGVTLDSDGADVYHGGVYAQGVGVFGVGVTLDRRGADSYRASESAQGCGYFGIGLCLDGAGDDSYYLYGDGQGLGGVGGGVGVLADFSGDDSYTAEPYSSVFNRGDYHSQMTINANNAQGAGMGRRGDGSDGHSWAGGLGALIDIHGADSYYSGNFTLGIGYWFGTGLVYDKNGADEYKSCYFTQGSGAHFCNGALIDESGDDIHELFETAGAAFGFGWDFTNALLLDKGGADRYRASMISFGLSQIRSTALFVDIGGADVYSFSEGIVGFGAATFRADYAEPSRLAPYLSYAKSFGAFIDIGGLDVYQSTTEDLTVTSVARNNTRWLQPDRADEHFGYNNFGVGIDSDSGTVRDFYLLE